MRSGPVVGVDVGTSSAKAVVFAAGSGVLGSGSAEHPTRVPRPGWAEQDPAAWWASVVAAVRAALADAGVAGRDVAAIAVSGQGAALVALDGAGMPVCPALIHLDQRAAAYAPSAVGSPRCQCSSVESRPTQPGGDHPPAASAVGSPRCQCSSVESRPTRPGGDHPPAASAVGSPRCQCSSVESGPTRPGGDRPPAASAVWRSDAAHGAWNVAAKLGWLRAEAPAAFESAAVFTSAAGYLLRRLTGRAWQSHSDAGISDLYDVAARGWSARGLAAVGVEPARLPRLASSTSVVGSLRPDAAADLGLTPSCLVVAGGEDTSSAALAAGVTGPADGFLSLGSAAVLGVAVPAGGDGLVPVLRFPHVLDGLDLLSGSNATVGAALQWLAGLVGRTVEELLALAATAPPGADGVDFLPYLAGELHPVADPSARGVFAGLSLAAAPGTLARAVVEGTATAIAHNLAAARSAGAAPDALVAVGGPARSELWCQAIADATGLPVRVASGAGAAAGDAMLAAGEDDDEARVLVATHLRTGRRYEPDPIEHQRAGERLERLQRLYAATRG